MQGADDGGSCAAVCAGVCGKSMASLLNSVVNLNCSKKMKSSKIKVVKDFGLIP